MKRGGMVLIVTVGILVLLSMAATVMARLAIQLRSQTGASIDQTTARLLARSGVMYASARLYQDSSPKVPPTAANQTDDWTYRDAPDVPLEKARNPSYAQTEPYVDVAVPGEQGRYSPQVDPYTDLDGNGRFDAWSGRLRNRYGMTRGTFTLKISGGNVDGGININAGCLAATDFNGNGRPDYQDCFQDPYWYASIVNGNDVVATIVDHLAEILGCSQRTAGEWIIGNRPLGGYRDLDEAARGFGASDWGRLRPHLSVQSGSNRYAFQASFAGDTPIRERGIPSFPLCRQQTLNVQDSSPEALAAFFMGLWENGGTVVEAFTSGLRQDEAERVAQFMKRARSRSRYDLYLKLMDGAPTLFPTRVVMGATAPLGLVDEKRLAAVVHAAAVQQPVGEQHFQMFGTGWTTYEKNWDAHATYLGRHDRGRGIARMVLSQLGGEVAPSMKPIQNDGPSLGFEPEERLSVACLGTVAGTSGLPAAKARCSAAVEVRALLEADSQDDFENLRFTPPGCADLCAAATAAGRPIRDRATTFPFFSRDAVPDLARQWPDRRIGKNGFTLRAVNDADYCRFWGEVALLDRCWIDGREVFYQPNWDRDQPARADVDPKTGLSDPDRLSWGRNFDDFAGGAGAAPRPPDWVIGCPYEATQCNAVETTVYYSTFSFSWGAGGANPGGFPAADAAGVLSQWTLEQWCGRSSWGNSSSEGGWWHYAARVGGHMGEVSGGGRGNPDHLSWLQATNSTGGSGSSWRDPAAIPNQSYNLVSWIYEDSKMTCYLNAVSHGGHDYETIAIDPSSVHRLDGMSGSSVDETRMYRYALERPAIQAHALRGRFWSADPLPDRTILGGSDLRAIPSFTSPRYRFDPPARFTSAQWDGFVPPVLVDATEAWNKAHPEEPKIPLRVELLLYDGAGTETRVELPPDSWKTGGDRIDLHQEGVRALRFKVWLDASALDQAYETPVFDGLRIGCKSTWLESLREQ